MIRKADRKDGQAIADIYNHYILNTAVTFEEQAVSADVMAGRIVDISESLPFLVFEQNGIIQGYAYASKWKGRCSYRYSVETTVYLDKDFRGRGAGSVLYAELLKQLTEKGLHTALAGISLPNEASAALHEKFGFRKIAHMSEVGFKFGKWIDVGYWQLMLNNKIAR